MRLNFKGCFLTLLCFFVASSCLYAQITETGTRVGINNSTPPSALTIGAGVATNTGTKGITLGSGENEIEMIHSNYGNGYGSKIYGVDEGNGVTSLRFAVRGGSTNWTNALYIRAADANAKNNGYIGIGTVNPTSKFFIKQAHDNASGGLTIADLSNRLIQIYGEGPSGRQVIRTSGTSNPLAIDLNGEERLRITASGDVGIGTTNPGNHKLAVNGTIKAKEVKVTMDGWFDFVFAKDYVLPPLVDMEQFIQQHHHLPEIPSEA